MGKITPNSFLVVVLIQLLVFKIFASSGQIEGQIIYIFFQVMTLASIVFGSFMINDGIKGGHPVPSIALFQNLKFYKKSEILNYKDFLVAKNSFSFIIKCNIFYITGLTLKKGFNVIDDTLLSMIGRLIDSNSQSDKESLIYKKIFDHAVKNANTSIKIKYINRFIILSETILLNALKKEVRENLSRIAKDAQDIITDYMKINLKRFNSDFVDIYGNASVRSRFFVHDFTMAIARENAKIEAIFYNTHEEFRREQERQWREKNYKKREYNRNYNNSNDLIQKLLKFFGFIGDYKPTKSEIKKAYRTMISKFHPDRNGHLSESELKDLETKSKEINANYDKLMTLI